MVVRRLGNTIAASGTPARITGSGSPTVVARLRDSAATSILGRSSAAGQPQDIAATADGQVLRQASGAVGWGSIPQSSVSSLTTDLATLTARQVSDTGGVTSAPNTTPVSTDVAVTLATGTYLIFGSGTYQTTAGLGLRSTFVAGGGLTVSAFNLVQRCITGATSEMVSSTQALGTMTAGTAGTLVAAPVNWMGEVVVTAGGTLTLQIASSGVTAVQLNRASFAFLKVA